MTDTPTPRHIEPLFASHARLWLRVWVITQGAALAMACYFVVERGSGVQAFAPTWRAPTPLDPFAMGVIALLVAYHAIGYVAYARIMRHPLAIAMFVPFGWVLVAMSFTVSGAFTLLTLGVIIQVFIFFPFAWAFASQFVAVALLLVVIVAKGNANEGNVTMVRAFGMLSVGIAIGTVMLYIHRVNRDSASRARLLAQLDEAQRDLATRAREAGVQEERQRLALDIHDTLAQGFTSVIRHLEAVDLSFGAGGDPEVLVKRAAPHLAHAQSVSRASLAEIRRVVWALRPPQLTEATLTAAIERLVTHWSGVNGVDATWQAGPVPPLIPDADVIFLRAAQEALSNVARHAHAAHVHVTLHTVDELVMLSVEDDGGGVVNADKAGADTIGLSGMRERARRFGGHVLIESADGSGTSVTVAMPLAAIAADAP